MLVAGHCSPLAIGYHTYTYLLLLDAYGNTVALCFAESAGNKLVMAEPVSCHPEASLRW